MAEVKKTVSTAKTEATAPVNAVKTTKATTVEKEPEVKKVEATVAEAAEKKAPAKKAPAQKAPAQKAPAKKAAPKKAAAKKAAAKKAPAKKEAAMDSAVYIQFDEKSISSDGLVERVKEIWKEKKNKATDLKDVKVYVNVAESKAYYVVNEDTFGSFDI